MVPMLEKKLELFKKFFPTVEIKSVDEKEGAEHYILDINDLWICKISKSDESSCLEIEANLLRLLHTKLRTKIPIIEYFEPHFMVYKKISGIELSYEIYKNLEQVQKNKLAYDIAFFLYELHNSLNIQDAGKIGLTNTYWPWFPEKLTQKAHLIQDVELKEIFKKFINRYRKIRRENESKLIHNDMILRNIIITKETGQLSGIIDFTEAAIDDPYIDLRLNYMSIPELSESVAKNYANIADKVPRIEKIYIYYIATEFSRYIQHIEEEKISELNKIKARVVNTFKYLGAS